MPHVTPEERIRRSREFRAQAKLCKDAVARRAFELAADRLERLAAKAVRRVGVAVRRRI